VKESGSHRAQTALVFWHLQSVALTRGGVPWWSDSLASATV